MPPNLGGLKTYNWEGVTPDGYFLDKLEPIPSALPSRSEERFSRNAETDLVCRLLLEKKQPSARPAQWLGRCLCRKPSGQIGRTALGSFHATNSANAGPRPA